MRGLSGVVVGTKVTDDISERILSMDVSLTTDMASQITFTVADPGLLMTRANYFQVRQVVTYLGYKWEMAAVEVQQGQAGEEVVLECRPQAIQKLKRDKGMRIFDEGTPTAFAAARAKDVGLGFFGELSPARGIISRIRNANTDESTWDVLQRLAGDVQFWCFESDGRLFFTSQYFLLGKFALVTANTKPGFLSTRIDWTTNGKVVQQPTPPPWYQIPPLDFITDNFLPFRVRDHREFNYVLTPQNPLNEMDEQGLRTRGENFRSHSQSGPATPRNP